MFAYIYCCLVTVLLSFPPLLTPTLYSPSHSQSPHCLCPLVLYLCSFACPFPFFPLLSTSPLFSGKCQLVLYFQVSGSILLICLFCWLGSTYRWDHMNVTSRKHTGWGNSPWDSMGQGEKASITNFLRLTAFTNWERKIL